VIEVGSEKEVRQLEGVVDKRKPGDKSERMIDKGGKAIRYEMRSRDGVRTGLIESRVKSRAATSTDSISPTYGYSTVTLTPVHVM